MKFFLTLFVLLSPLAALEKMDSSYRVSYGNPSAPIKVIEYFSLSCPGCVSLYRSDFDKIKKELINKGEIYYEYHPVPLDAFTLRVCHCLQALESKEDKNVKKIALLESMLENISVGSIDDNTLNTKLLKFAMETLKCPASEVDSDTFLQESKAFEDALIFVTQEDIITEMPSIEINGELIEGVIPSFSFLDEISNSSKYKLQNETIQ